MDDDVVEMENYAKLQDVEDVSECAVMKEAIRVAGFALISNVSYCLVDKIDKADELVRDIVLIGQTAMENITAIKNEADDCVRDADTLSKISSALACVATAGLKVSWIITSQIPAVSLDLAQITYQIVMLEPALQFCVPKNAILTLAAKSREVVESIIACISEKIDEAKPSTQDNSLNDEDFSSNDNEDEGFTNEDSQQHDQNEEYYDKVDNDNSGLLEY